MEKIVYVCWMRERDTWEGCWLSIEELAKLFKDRTLIYVWTAGTKYWNVTHWTGHFGWGQYVEFPAPWPDQYENWEEDDWSPNV